MIKTSTLLSILFLFIVSRGYTQVNLQAGLVAAYPMNNSTLDSTSNHLDLTAYGSPVGAMDRFGNVNGAYSLDSATPDYFKSAYNTLLSPAALTLSAWVNLSTPMKDQKIAGMASVGAGYLMGVDSNMIDAEIWDSYSNHYRIKAGNIPASTWTHLAISFQANDFLRLYINGLLIDSVSSGFFPAGVSNSSPFTVGGAPWQATALNANGSIDDIYLYNRVLSAAEIFALYSLVTGTIEGTPTFSMALPYPTPVHEGSVTLDFNDPANGYVFVNVTDARGRIVCSTYFFNPKKERLDLGNLQSGLYSLSLTNKGRTETHKLIVH